MIFRFGFLYSFVFLLLLIFVMSPSVVSQTSVYKCIDEEGTTVFSNLPCSEDPEVHAIEEGYRPDPNNPVAPRRPPALPRSQSQDQASDLDQRSSTSSIGQSSPQKRMATKCTSQAGGRIYYTTGGCGRSSEPASVNITGGGTGSALVTTQDIASTATYQEACSWAQRRADNTRLSSTQRRSARSLEKQFCDQ